MAIQIVPRPAEKPPIWINILFYGSFALAIISVLSFFVIWFFQTKTEKTILSLDTQAAQLENSPEATLEKEVLASQWKINDFSFLLGKYKYTSKIFGFLENFTHPNVYFSNFNFNLDEGKVGLSGTADSFQTLDQQLKIFEQESLIESVALSNTGFTNNGEISFSFVLKLNPKVFQK